MGALRYIILLAALLLGACSMRSAVETFSSEQDRAFAVQMVDHLRKGDRDWLERHFVPELWAQSGGQLGSVPAMFPRETGTTEIIGFNISTNMTGGRTERSKEFSLVTHGGGRWTVTHFRTYSTGGPDRVVEWRVTPHNAVPAELAILQAWDRMLPWVWAGMAAAVLGFAALVVWLVRRSRRRGPEPIR